MAKTDDVCVNRAKAIVDAMLANRGAAAGRLPSDALIPLLQDLQDSYGYLPLKALQRVSELSGIPLSRMYGVITFYGQFYTEPRGRHMIKCCQGTACHVKGSARIGEAIMQHLNVEEGGTTEDLRFTYESVACLGTCFLAPVKMINDDYYGELSPDKIPKILAKYE